jgi:hypothetical protein
MKQIETVPLCDFRKKRPVSGVSGQFEYYCLAADQRSLGTVGSSPERLRAICGDCPIPEEMTANEPLCYFLRPIRLIDENRSFFPCRNYPGVFRKKWPEDLSSCNSCQFGFPRPQLDQIRYYAEDIHRLHLRIRTFLNFEGEERRAMDEALSWNKRLWWKVLRIWLA